MSDTRNHELTRAVRRALECSGLHLTWSDSEITITDRRQPEMGSFSIDYKCRYLAWEHTEHDYWHFDELTDDQAAVLIAGKIRQILGKHVRLPSQIEAQVELARREELSARVMSGDLDDVRLHVRRG
ncbi:MAG TPA: hypothetical protein VMC83_09840 [Streptosporangiaceae bacterium]|nr:hypothetical protein [Streptosporangiaceae bacterium]HUC27436.1 hypothetical protein [Streptosporangiaceae bacterium]